MTKRPEHVESSLDLRRVLVVNPIWPCADHSVRAANVVIYELVAQLARQAGLKIGFLKLAAHDAAAPNAAESGGIRALETLGVAFLDPISLAAAASPRGQRRRVPRADL